MTYSLIILCSIADRKLHRRNTSFARSLPNERNLSCRIDLCSLVQSPETVVEFQKEILRDAVMGEFPFEKRDERHMLYMNSGTYRLLSEVRAGTTGTSDQEYHSAGAVQEVSEA